MAVNATTSKIYKVLGLFTGTQLVGVICSVLRTKAMAIWGGTAGVGLLGIYGVALEMLATATQFSLRGSSVRSLAAAPKNAKSEMASVIMRWGALLGVLGIIVAGAFSGILSNISFGNSSHWPWFALLGIALLASSWSNGMQAVLQGFGKLKKLAAANLWGSIIALVATIPVIYCFGARSTVSVLIIFSCSTAICLGISMRNERFPSVTTRTMLETGNGFMKLGGYMTVASLATWGANYLLLSWITSHCGEETTGLFQAGNTLTVRYAGILFTALSMEFYPRISAVSHSKLYTGVYLNHEIAVLLKIAAPVGALFAICTPIVVTLLYSEAFLEAVPYITIAVVGIVARAASWCMGYVVLARGDGRTYIVTELVSAGLYLLLSISGYLVFGITGFGIAFTLWYMVYLAMMWSVVKIRYGLSLKSSTIAIIAGAITLVTAASIASLYLQGWSF